MKISKKSEDHGQVCEIKCPCGRRIAVRVGCDPYQPTTIRCRCGKLAVAYYNAEKWKLAVKEVKDTAEAENLITKLHRRDRETMTCRFCGERFLWERYQPAKRGSHFYHVRHDPERLRERRTPGWITSHTEKARQIRQTTTNRTPLLAQNDNGGMDAAIPTFAAVITLNNKILILTGNKRNSRKFWINIAATSNAALKQLDRPATQHDPNSPRETFPLHHFYRK